MNAAELLQDMTIRSRLNSIHRAAICTQEAVTELLAMPLIESTDWKGNKRALKYSIDLQARLYKGLP